MFLEYLSHLVILFLMISQIFLDMNVFRFFVLRYRDSLFFSSLLSIFLYLGDLRFPSFLLFSRFYLFFIISLFNGCFPIHLFNSKTMYSLHFCFPLLCRKCDSWRDCGIWWRTWYCWRSAHRSAYRQRSRLSSATISTMRCKWLSRRSRITHSRCEISREAPSEVRGRRLVRLRSSTAVNDNYDFVRGMHPDGFTNAGCNC